NEYTALLSMVRLASQNLPGQAVGLLDDVASRLQASAMAYRALRPPRGTSMRSLDLELKTLCEALSDSILAGSQVRLSLASEPVPVGARRCWQISLIVSELVINAARHAFKSGNSGRIMIDVRLLGGTIQCTVVDNGVSDIVISPGRGSAIVDALASELGGRVV